MPPRKQSRPPQTVSFLDRARGLGRRARVAGLPDGFGDCYAAPMSRAAMRDASNACLRAGAKPGDADAYDNDRLTLLIVAASIVDGSGNRLIPEGSEPAIEEFAADVATALTMAALRVNGMAGDADSEGDSAKN
jgi:hypothetical protein